MYNLENTISEFNKIVSKEICEDMARKTSFVQRSTSQLLGYEFAQAMMIPNACLEAETLNALAARMHSINPGCNLTASALAQRINTKQAQKFMRSCFGHTLKKVTQKDFRGVGDLNNLLGFNRILIEDSTIAELHEKLSESFSGRGGSASKAAVKINYIFDYLSETFLDISFHSGNMPDQSLAGRVLDIIEKDDLIIRDLGYYALEKFKKIEKQEAYYISRHKSDVLVYASKDAQKPLDLAKFLDKQAVRGITDTVVYLGKERHEVRLVACRMDEQSINKRRRSANKIAKKRGRMISAKASSLMDFSIFITNVPSSILSATDIMACYRARWRIELIFKQWKTCLKLHIFRGFNKERFHCFLYGRLIMILLIAWLSPPLIQYAISLGRELSTFKLTNYLVFDCALSTAVRNGSLEQFMKQLLQDLPRRLCMDKRIRKSLRMNVRQGKSWCNDLEFMNLCSI